MSEDDLQHPRRSAEESNFLADVFERADPAVAAFMARHNALLERVTVLERALESIADPAYYPPSMRDSNGAKGIRVMAKRALDG